jgi:hypothetical protein
MYSLIYALTGFRLIGIRIGVGEVVRGIENGEVPSTPICTATLAGPRGQPSSWTDWRFVVNLSD